MPSIRSMLAAIGLLVSPRSQALAADPTCATGILQGTTCCEHSCGSCGGPDCGSLPGGSAGCCTRAIEEANQSCDKTDPPCVLSPPPVPTTCGHYPEPLTTDRPNVLLIGDSISMPVPYSPGGYGANARELLENRSVNVWHNGGWDAGGQASNTVKGLLCTNASTPGNWLNITEGMKYDVVHFNFGLHDLVDYGPGEGHEHVNLTDYGHNLVVRDACRLRVKSFIHAGRCDCTNVAGSHVLCSSRSLARSIGVLL